MEYLNWCAEHPILTFFAMMAVVGCFEAVFSKSVTVKLKKDDE